MKYTIYRSDDCGSSYDKVKESNSIQELESLPFTKEDYLRWAIEDDKGTVVAVADFMLEQIVKAVSSGSMILTSDPFMIRMGEHVKEALKDGK